MTEKGLLKQFPTEASTGRFARHLSAFTAATLLSRILGYFRDVAIVYVFGGGGLADAYYAAFRLANFFRRTLGEGALNASFVPVLTQEKAKGTRNAQEFLASLWTALAAVTGLIVLVGIWQAGPIVLAFTYGFASDPAKLSLTTDLFRVLAPHLFFVTSAALAQGTLNVTRRFFLPALAPLAFSVAILGYLGMLHAGWIGLEGARAQVLGLAAAATLGGALQWLLQLPMLEREGLGLRLRNPSAHPAVWQVAAMMGPSVLTLATDQVDALVDTVFASFMVEGSITAIYNASRLMQLPLALFGVASATVALTHLSEHASAGRTREFRATLRDSLGITSFVLMPATAGLMVISLPLVRTLFEHGAFSPEASALTARALFWYALGLTAYGWAKVLVMAHYALRDAAGPVRISAVKVGLNVLFCALLAGPMGVGGLALAASVTSWLGVAWLLRSVAGKTGGWDPGLLGSAAKSAAASALMGVGVYAGLYALRAAFPSVPPSVQVAAAIAAAVPAYYGLAVLLGIEERRLVWKVLGRGAPDEN